MAEERRLAAIMFVDICGFSSMMGSNEQKALTIVDLATSVIESATDAYDGRIIKKMGDGFLAEFSSAVNATQAALDVQRAVARHNDRTDDDDKFQLRIGIHVGDVVVADGDIFGDGVNVAARIEPLAEPGGICISRDVLDMIHNKIAVETVKLGPQDLKNIARKIDIYGVLVDAMSGGKTIRMHRRRKAGRVVKRVAIGVGILVGVLVLLGILGKIGDHKAYRNAEAAFRRTEAAAREAADAGRLQEALEILQAYPEEFRHTEFQQHVDDGIGTVHKELVRQELGRRTEMFIRSVNDGNKDAAMSLLDPAVFRNVDASALWMRLRLASGVFKLAAESPDSIRIKEIDVAEDDSNAMVFMEFRKKGAVSWDSPPPWEWRNFDGEWLLHMEPPPKPETDLPARPVPAALRRRLGR